MGWTEDERRRLSDLQLPRERGGHQPEAVEVLLEATTACMSAGRQIPDPTTFALPTRTLGQGYARAQVRDLVELLRDLRQTYAEREQTHRTEPEPQAPVLSGVGAPERGRARWDQAQLDWVRTTRFATVRRGGYDAGEVDDLLDAVLVAMAHGEPLPDIDRARFSASRLGRGGYDVRQVDGFLDELRAQTPRG